MTQRTFTTKSGTTFEWEETPEIIEAIQKLNNFSGNYNGPLYAPHPDLSNENKIND
jgi:hypothetical protein